MKARPATSYLVRAVVINALLIAGVVQVQRNGRLTGGMIALYLGMAVLANVLMYYGARARRKLEDR